MFHFDGGNNNPLSTKVKAEPEVHLSNRYDRLNHVWHFLRHVVVWWLWYRRSFWHGTPFTFLYFNKFSEKKKQLHENCGKPRTGLATLDGGHQRKLRVFYVNKYAPSVYSWWCRTMSRVIGFPVQSTLGLTREIVKITEANFRSFFER